MRSSAFRPSPSSRARATSGTSSSTLPLIVRGRTISAAWLAANTDFVRNNPVATKRALRAILRATDICHGQPERVAQRMADFGFSYECALMILKDARYGLWREYDPEDTVRFFALRLHELGMIKKTPNEVISGFTDWRFLDEIKRELKT